MNEQHPNSSLNPPVGIIMRSKNEMPYTVPTLECLYQQSYTPFTLYNVDSGSTDGTLEALQRFNPHPENITQIEPEAYIPGRVLNQMIAQAPEPIIVLLNADCVPTNIHWLENLLQPLLNGGADGVTSRQLARPDAYFIVQYDLDRAFGDADLSNKRHGFFSAAACAFKRDLWEATPFPEEGWGEDFAWASQCKEKGARFEIAVDSVVEHSHNYTLKTLYKRERGHGIVHFETLGEQPALIRQCFSCFKHLVRDCLFALKKGRIFTIPYNMVYRVTIHWAQYQGKRAGHKNRGFPQEFFRE